MMRLTYENVVADFSELALDLFAVLFGHLLFPLGRAIRLLFDGGDHSPRRPPGTNNVLEKNTSIVNYQLLLTNRASADSRSRDRGPE